LKKSEADCLAVLAFQNPVEFDRQLNRQIGHFGATAKRE